MADSACIFYRLPPPSHLPLSGLPVIDSFHGKSLHNRRKEYDGIDASKQDVIIQAAAVCDYRVEKQHSTKIKKADGEPMVLTLTENPDIAQAVGKLKEKYWREAVAEYSKRLGAYCSLEIVELKESPLRANPSPADEEAVKSLLQRLS